MSGNFDGMEGIEGIFVGIVDNGVAGNECGITFVIVGTFGKVGFAESGSWVLASGSHVDFGRVDSDGINSIGIWLVGNCGN
jgi:hypothetical protein